jgi:hypothetical protein
MPCLCYFICTFMLNKFRMKKYFLASLILISGEFIFAQGGGPWQHKVYRAVSSDGVNFTRDTTLLFFPASVPGAVADTNQMVYLYYVHMDNSLSPETLMVAASPDGQYFLDPLPVNISGSSITRKVDPDPVLLPDGRIRLYYIDFDTQPPQCVHSAVSSDGINFTEEAGLRFSDASGITDPDVFNSGGTWNMYVSKGTQLIRATSADGLNFTKDNSFNWNKGAVSSTMMFSCGLFRTYYCGSSGIMSATSAVGDTLTPEAGARILPEADEFVCDPTIVLSYNGEYILYFKSFFNDPGDLHEYSCSCHPLNFPNPFHDETIISIPEEIDHKKSFLLKVFDLSGKLLRSENIYGKENIIFSGNDLEPGLYLYRIEQGNMISLNGKFIIE